MLKLYDWYQDADYYRLTAESFDTVVRRYKSEFKPRRPKGCPERDLLPGLPTMDALMLEAELQIRQKRQQLKDMAERKRRLEKAKASKQRSPPKAPERAVRPWFWLWPFSVAFGMISYLQPKLMQMALKACGIVATTTISVSWGALRRAAQAAKSTIHRSFGAIRNLV